MPLWGTLGSANNKPKYFSNTADVVSVNVATEQANHNLAHAGWVVEHTTSAPVTLTIAAGGTGYANGEALVFTGGTRAANTTAPAGTVHTDGTGVITSLTITNGGSYITTTAPTMSVTTAAGTGASITGAILNGRVGRKMYEVLVAGSFNDPITA